MSDMSPAGKPTWYSGRFAVRRGSLGLVEVLASDFGEGWKAIEDAKQLFPKTGHVELSGASVFAFRPGDWLAFQLGNIRRAKASYLTVAAHRLLPRYCDMSDLNSVEAARVMFAINGWSGNPPGHWAVRIAPDRVLLLDLGRQRGDKLRVAPLSLHRIPGYPFDAANVIAEPGLDDPANLYDFRGSQTKEVYDWSADADYVANVIQSLSGKNERALKDIISWLKLHRDGDTGSISATRADPEKAYEALRSGELAKRLETDQALTKAYITALRDDPTIARIIAEAAADITTRERKQIEASLRAELATEFSLKREKQTEELQIRERALVTELHERIAEQQATMERELQQRVALLQAEAEEQAIARKSVLAAEVGTLVKDRDSQLEEIARLRSEVEVLTEGVAELSEKSRLAEEEFNRRRSMAEVIRVPGQVGASALVRFPDTSTVSTVPLTIEALAQSISRMALLTPRGKVLMERFAALMLAGEIPVLEGDRTEDFALVAESLMAAGRLVPFDIDATILTPEDIWSRPGSGIPTQVAEACNLAEQRGLTFLVQLRGIERSAARSWFPALARLGQRGLLPRRVLLFATIIDLESSEVNALPDDVCRLKVHDATVTDAWAAAPSILGSGPTSAAFHLDPGDRVSDLSPATAVLPRLGARLDFATSLRTARVVVESLRLRPGDEAAALDAGRILSARNGNWETPHTRNAGEVKRNA